MAATQESNAQGRTSGDTMSTSHGNENDQSQSNIKHNNDSRNNNKKDADAKTQYTHSKPITHGGENEDIGVILTLSDERFQKRVVYSVFIEKLKNYVLQNFNDAKDMIPIIEKLEDPKTAILTTQPKDLTTEETKSEVKKWIKQEEVKKHIKRLTNLDNNKETLYGIVWGQCSVALQEVMKTDSDFISKDSDFDCIWLLKKCKMISSGIDNKGNKHNTLLKAILQLCNIKQQSHESNDSFRTRLDASVLTLELAGGKHVLCSDVLLKAKDVTNPTTEEIKAEENKLKAMLMIIRSDTTLYSALHTSLEDGIFLGRDEYPITVTAA